MRGFFDKEVFEIKYVNYTKDGMKKNKGEQLIAMDSDILESRF